MAHVTLKGEDVELLGSFLKKGNLAPDFALVSHEMETVTLEDFKNHKKVIATVPSIDTPVCSEESIKLNELAMKFPDVMIFVISKDLPFAQSRFCKDHKIENIKLLSDIRPKSNFAKDYGVLIGSGPLEGLLTRTILVLNEHDKVIHSEIVSEITHFPNFDEIFQVLEESNTENV